MGPWQCYHLHEFNFQAESDSSRNFLSPRHDVLRIVPADLLEEEEDDIMPMPGMPSSRPVRTEGEENILLSDVYDSAGRLRSVAAPNGEFLPLIYLYDFGVCVIRLFTAIIS
jgi:hypothetical protein